MISNKITQQTSACNGQFCYVTTNLFEMLEESQNLDMLYGQFKPIKQRKRVYVILTQNGKGKK